jgi:hypothetical protein
MSGMMRGRRSWYNPAMRVRRIPAAVVAVVAVALFAVSSIALPGQAQAQDARQRLTTAAEELEARIRNTRWDYNHIADKKALEAQLQEMNRILDAIALYESDLRCPNFPGSQGSRATDEEVQVIANIVHMRMLLNDRTHWSFANSDEQQKLKEALWKNEALLRELQVQHCH